MRVPGRIAGRLALAAVGWLLASCGAIQPQPLTPFADGDHWMLERPLSYRDWEKGKEVVVPAGFVTDFASVPKWGHSIYGPTGRYQFPAVVHDYLYWEQTTTKEEADQVFLRAMKDSQVDDRTRTILYEAVDKGGGGAWDNNRAERRRGMPRVVPEKFRSIPPNTTWSEYRTYLHNRGVRP